MPTPYSRSSPSWIPKGFVTFTINLWGTWVRIPTPSPVSPSASLPALCSKFSTIFKAFSTVPWLFFPLISTHAPIPQLSCSNTSRYRGAIGTARFASNIIYLISAQFLCMYNLLFHKKELAQRPIPSDLQRCGVISYNIKIAAKSLSFASLRLTGITIHLSLRFVNYFFLRIV